MSRNTPAINSVAFLLLLLFLLLLFLSWFVRRITQDIKSYSVENYRWKVTSLRCSECNLGGVVRVHEVILCLFRVGRVSTSGKGGRENEESDLSSVIDVRGDLTIIEKG